MHVLERSPHWDPKNFKMGVIGSTGMNYCGKSLKFNAKH